MRLSLEKAFERLRLDDEARVCKDIPDAACRMEPGNRLVHTIALTASKFADGLIDPKLVLSWLFTALGVPAALIGLLVPVREAGALLPQLFTAGALRAMPIRKYAWTAGALGQGTMALIIAIAALTLEGAAAGWVIVTALGGLALSRSVCSVTYKDVLGKTIDRQKRGSVTGLATSLAAGLVILFAATLILAPDRRMALVTGALFLAGVLWALGALIFTGLKEEPGATEGGGNAIEVALGSIPRLWKDIALRDFIAARALLIATALAPPFMIAAAPGEGAADQLGFFVLASAGAGLLSGRVWGGLSDRSSRKVLIASGGVAGTILLLTVLSEAFGLLAAPLVLPGLIFGLMLAYQGVRLGRSTHLVDMGTEETRATYTALSNTVIGLVLIAGAGFSILAALAGPVTVIAVMAVMSLAGAAVAFRLEEVQN